MLIGNRSVWIVKPLALATCLITVPVAVSVKSAKLIEAPASFCVPKLVFATVIVVLPEPLEGVNTPVLSPALWTVPRVQAPALTKLLVFVPEPLALTTRGVIENNCERLW